MPVEWFGDELLRQIREESPDAFFEAGEMLIQTAAAKVPKLSGDLANSGYVANENKSTYQAGKKNRRELKPEKGTTIAAFAAFYARFVEYGTKNKAARPFLRPTLDELKDKMGQKIVVRIKNRIK